MPSILNAEVRVRAVLRTAAVLALVLAWGAPSDGGEITIVFRDGLVTLTATNASPREILAEWARLGRTRVVNAERASATPVSLQIVDAPESRVIEILLRGTAGYITAPRQASISDASVYDRILIAPVAAPSATARPVASAAAPVASRGSFGQQTVLADAPAVDPEDGPPRRQLERLPYGQSPYGGSFMPSGAGGQAFPGGTRDVAESAVLRATGEAQQQSAVSASIPGVMTPGTAGPNPQSANATATTQAVGASRPGVTVPAPVVSNPYGIANTIQPTATPANALNPYGLPNNVRPGSEVGPAVEPDRSKYMNPATPQKPPGGGGGGPEA